jgi:hypothetical protein
MRWLIIGETIFKEDDLMAEDILGLADGLKELKEYKKRLEEQLKDVNEQIALMEERLAEMMIAEEMQNFTRNGLIFYLSTKIYASAVADRKEELFAWLKENGYGDLVYETVNANSLAAFIREQLEEVEELPEELAKLVNVYEKTTVGMRKAPVKKK